MNYDLHKNTTIIEPVQDFTDPKPLVCSDSKESTPKPKPEISKFDSNVSKVVELLYSRMERGYQKYGVTTERNDIDFLGWIQHLQEELLDASIYLERLKKEYNESR